MEKKRLINIAKNISQERGTEKYFEFASNYLMNEMQSGIKSTNKFFKMLQVCKDKTNLSTVKHAFGVVGNNNPHIDKWIANIIHNNDSKNLPIDELYYVMSMASRYAKVYDTENVTKKYTR